MHGRRAPEPRAARERLRRPARRRRVRRAGHATSTASRTRSRPPTRVRAAISERLELEEIGVEVEASVGIALYPEHGEDPETLLQHADVAMYVAKRGAQRPCASTTAPTDRYSRDNLGLIADLRRAIDDDELVLHFQPKAEVATGRIVGVEALVRWEHPERGFLFPDAFIPLAENTGLIRPLTLHVLDRALAQCRTWSDDGLVLGMAVNVSTRNLLDLTLPDEVDTLLRAARRPGRAARARDHRDDDHGRPAARQGRARAPERDGRRASPSTTSAPATRRSPGCATCR